MYFTDEELEHLAAGLSWLLERGDQGDEEVLRILALQTRLTDDLEARALS